MLMWHCPGVPGRVFASPCEAVYMMNCHYMADDARDMPRGAEVLASGVQLQQLEQLGCTPLTDENSARG